MVRRGFGLFLLSLWSEIAVAIEPSFLTIESSPSALLMGNVLIHAEAPANGRGWYYYGRLDRAQFSNHELSSQGTSTSLDLGLAFYPRLFATHGPFLAFGAGSSQLVQTVTRHRPSRTYFRPTDTETRDRWTEMGRYLSLTQSLGYRIRLSGLATSSFGVSSAEILHSSSEIRDASLMPETDVDSTEPDRVSFKFFLHMGFFFQ
jgi:hypothetical protein